MEKGDLEREETKAELIERIYDIILDQTESLEEQNIGAAFAYLVGAILKKSTVDIHGSEKTDQHVGPLFRLLRRSLPHNDYVFEYFGYA